MLSNIITSISFYITGNYNENYKKGENRVANGTPIGTNELTDGNLKALELFFLEISFVLIIILHLTMTKHKPYGRKALTFILVVV